MTARRIAAVMVSYRTGPVLFEAIAAALAAADVCALALVDNGNPSTVEARLDALAAAEPRLTVLRGQGNVGFARACNLAAREASGAADGPSHLLFVNPDAVLSPDAPAALAEALAGRARPAIAGARILDAEGREQRGSRRRAPSLARALGAALGGGADRMHLEAEPVPDGPIAVDAVSGACLMLTAADFAALGGFDEAYFLHVEDLDLCRRAWEAGGEVAFVPGARAHHVGGTSAASGLFVAWCKGRGLARYFVRYAPGPTGRALAWLAGPGVVAVALVRAALGRGGGAAELGGHSQASTRARHPGRSGGGREEPGPAERRD